MTCLVLLDGFGEEEGSPICQTADYAAVGEDEGTSCASDSVEEAMSVGKERQLLWSVGIGEGTL